MLYFHFVTARTNLFLGFSAQIVRNERERNRERIMIKQSDILRTFSFEVAVVDLKVRFHSRD